MTCPKCGHQLVERKGRFTIVDTSCPRCGTSLLPAQEAKEQPKDHSPQTGQKQEDDK